MGVQLLIASSNRHKVAEFRALLNGSGFEVLGAADLGLELEVDETGNSYEENASLKAQSYAAMSGMLALGDDSGLEVDALDGAPGIFSARFGDPSLTDAGRASLVLERLRGTPAERRSARFRCVLVGAAPGGRTWRVEGCCEGAIAGGPRGQNGFGYDPIFIVEGGDRTMAELSAEAKNQISHRARAVAALLPVLAAAEMEVRDDVRDQV